ncbi:MAG: hypothetical protein RBU30_13295 [Polyangia bacterium]|jgi:hypothetical protein|nr:hypothetical protein [Polyangia bacterium]
MAAITTGSTFKAPDGQSWAERRRLAPTSFELYKANAQALEAAGVASCLMRYSLVGEAISFFFKFENEVPSGRIGFTFPMMYPENLIKEGWKKYFLTLQIQSGGQLTVNARGRFVREDVPLEIEAELQRAVGGGQSFPQDLITWTDQRTKEQGSESMAGLLGTTLKDGTPKYCRKGDNLRDLSVEGWVAVLTRFVKDSALRRKAIKV